MGLSKKYQRTTLFILDADLWAWAKYRAELKGFKHVSDFLFYLIKKEKESSEEQSEE